nr:peptidoglycan-binding protein [Acuticoccus kalidii]
MTEHIDRLPIEDWAAVVSQTGRRIRRRVMRRKGATAASVAGIAIVAVVASNALWQQDERHPAPLWGAGESAQSFAAHNGADNDPIREITLDAGQTDADISLIEDVQAGLAEAGYYSGEVTGILDEPTAEAIRQFERDRGLPETGQPNVAIVAAVSVDAPRPVVAEPAPVTRRPAAQMDIFEVQALLNERGFGPVSVDGKMGPQTRSALERFSAARGLRSQGMTPEVLRALAGEGA